MVKQQRGSEKAPLARASTAPEVTSSKHSNRGKRRTWSGARLKTTETNNDVPTSPHVAAAASPHDLSPTSPAQYVGSNKKAQGHSKLTAPEPFRERGVWAQVASELEEYDEKMVSRWNEQIDTLLVFAGLFSAVVTAFNVESYRQLRLDADEASKMLLVTISQQLSDLPRALLSNSTTSATAAVLSQIDSFKPQSTDILINALWFSSLVCSLVAASLGILVKQWLQRYKTEDYSLARERMRIRQHRFDGLMTWSVPGIVAFLPLLLRTSLNLFFIGLIVFVKTLDQTVFGVISSLIAVWFLAYSLSSLLPCLYRSCPYKSPEATAFYFIRRMFADGIRRSMRHRKFISWSDNEESVKQDPMYDVHILTTVDKTFSDRTLDHFIRECIKDFPKTQVMLCIRNIISYRLRITLIPDWAYLDTSYITKRCSESLINILLDTFDRLEQIFHPSNVAEDIEWLSDSLGCIASLIQVTYWGSAMASFDERLMAILPKLMDAAATSQYSFEVYELVITVLFNRRVLHYAPTLSVLHKFLSGAMVTMRTQKEGTFLAKTSAVMLSLVALAGPDSIDDDIFKTFVSVCDAALFTCDLPLENFSSGGNDMYQALEVCREKVQELEAKKAGICGDLLSTVEVCIDRLETNQQGI